MSRIASPAPIRPERGRLAAALLQGDIEMKNVIKGALAVVALALPTLALAAEPLKAAVCACCPGCGCC